MESMSRKNLILMYLENQKAASIISLYVPTFQFSLLYCTLLSIYVFKFIHYLRFVIKELKIKAYYPLAHLFLGELYLNAGEKEKAIDNLKKAEEMFREMGMDYWLTRMQKALGRL